MPDRKPRHGVEVCCEYAFRPIAHVLARSLRPLGVPPPAVVAASTCVGLSAAGVIGGGHLLAGAVLLQIKTVLDNADGQLARLTGRISAFGRYLDSESDLLVDAAVFAALGRFIGPGPALIGFITLTFVLSANFNVERLYRQATGAVPPVLPDEATRRARIAAGIYRAVYAPQDHVFELVAGRRGPAWHEPVGVQVLANLGLSTQLTVLGACLALGSPVAYVYILLGCAALTFMVFVRREVLVRRTTESLLAVE
jgi:phosphatidylglycerophosphate synthase